LIELAIESISPIPQDFLTGKLGSALSLNLSVTRLASGTATGLETKTFTASLAEYSSHLFEVRWCCPVGAWL
jgi:hypothetical protein